MTIGLDLKGMRNNELFLAKNRVVLEQNVFNGDDTDRGSGGFGSTGAF